MQTLPVTTVTGKKCSRCGDVKPLTDFWPERRRPGRFRAACIVCSKRDDRARYRVDPSRHSRCSMAWVKAHPDKARAIRERYEAKHGDRIRAKARAEYAEKQRDKRAAYRKANVERIKANAATYRERNREKIREAAREYREANKEACRERIRQSMEKDPEKYKAMHSSWKKRNRDACNASYNRYRTRVLGNGGTLTKDEWAGIKAAQDHRCLMCRRQEPEIKLTMDHILPVSEGGRTDRENIQGLCRSCNSKKHRKVVDLRGQLERNQP